MRLTPFAALCLLVLGGCSNQVYSRQPLLAETFQRGDPLLRPGLWEVVGQQDEACPFVLRSALYRWPDCATALEYQRGEWWLVGPRTRILAQTVRLAPGDPIIMQRHWSPDALKHPRAVQPRNADNPFFGWTYALVSPTKMDSADRIIEARVVEATCGPLAPGETVTTRPYPGLAMAGQNCVTDNLETVTSALDRSALAAPAITLRWVRDRP